MKHAALGIGIRLTLSAALALFAAATLPARGASPASEDVRDLTPLLTPAVGEHKLPAVAALVIENGRVVARGVDGVRKAGTVVRAEPGDRWHLGSCTKAMTATMIAILIERGQMSWDTTIRQALPDLADKMQPEYRNVTVEMLLAHRGGIGSEGDVPGLWPELWKRTGTPVEQRRRMAAAMLANPPKVPPGEYFYANCGYGIAGHMAETITGKPWETLMQELVFTPLGMKTAGFGVPGDEKHIAEPWPHNKDGTPISPGPMADNPRSIGPGGTVHASLDDWAKFVADHLRGARGEDGKLLKAATYRRLHRGRKTGPGDDEYALGWSVTRRPWAKGKEAGDTGRCLTHAGSNNSWFCVVWIAPERNFAVLCVTNIGGDGIYPKLDAVAGNVILDYVKRHAD